MTKLFLPILLTLWFQNVFAQSDSVYMFSYFKNNGEDGMHLAYSKDGYQWKALNNDVAVLKPEAGNDKLMRDPCIVAGGDGLFHMVWTVSWHEPLIGYASSPDLVHWSVQQAIPVMGKDTGVQNCWAPEIFYDRKSANYMIYWSSTVNGRFPETLSGGDMNHRIYYVVTKDFKKFSPAKLLYNKGFNVIDATIVQAGKKYIMFLKNEIKLPKAEKNIRIATSKKLTGGYSSASLPITGNYWAEGPTAIQVKGKWIVYFDKYVNRKYGAVESEDLQHWNDVSDRLDMPVGIKHGTVFKISAIQFNNIKLQL
ncbi:MAG: glycoside hydrolase family 43 protein [Niabella sp.]